MPPKYGDVEHVDTTLTKLDRLGGKGERRRGAGTDFLIEAGRKCAARKSYKEKNGLHQFTNGSQTRRKLRRRAKIAKALRDNQSAMTAQQIADLLGASLRTVQRSLSVLVRNCEVSRTTSAAATGTEVYYRAVLP